MHSWACAGLGDRPEHRGRRRGVALGAGAVVAGGDDDEDARVHEQVDGLAQRRLARGVVVRVPLAAQAHVDAVHAQDTGVDVHLHAQIGQGADDGGGRRHPLPRRAAPHHLEADELAVRRHARESAGVRPRHEAAVLLLLRARDLRGGLVGTAAGDDAGDMGAVAAVVVQGGDVRRVGRRRRGNRRVRGVDEVGEVAVQPHRGAVLRRGAGGLGGELEPGEVGVRRVDPAVDDGPDDATTPRRIRAPGGVGLDGRRRPVDLRVERVVGPDPEDGGRRRAAVADAAPVVLDELRGLGPREHALVELRRDEREPPRHRRLDRARRGAVLVGGGERRVCVPHLVEVVAHRLEAAGVPHVELDDHGDAFVGADVPLRAGSRGPG